MRWVRDYVQILGESTEGRPNRCLGKVVLLGLSIPDTVKTNLFSFLILHIYGKEAMCFDLYMYVKQWPFVAASWQNQPPTPTTKPLTSKLCDIQP